MIAGIGSDNLRKIEVDDAFAMNPAALDRAIRDDVAAGVARLDRPDGATPPNRDP